MIHTRFDAENGRFIETYDDVFAAKEIIKFNIYAEQANYKICRTSTGLIAEKSLATLKCDLSFQEALQFGVISSPNFKTFYKILKEKNVRLDRSYINLCTSDDLFPYHTDSCDEDGLTMLYYINAVWEPMWEGETHFTNENLRSIILSSSFIPGSMAVFTPTIPQKSSQPSRAATSFSYSYAMKFVYRNNKSSCDKAIDLTEHVHPSCLM